MRKLFVIAFAILFAHVAMACDMCGGGASSQYIGLLPGLNRNFVGVQFLTGSFTSRFPSVYHLLPQPDEVTNDKYNTLQIWGRHKIGENYQVFAFIPYQYNVKNRNGEKLYNSGMGDVTFLVNRTILNSEKSGWQHVVFGGAGIKLPTGSNKSIEENAKSTFATMKPGTGTWDFLFNTNYTVQNKYFGLNLDPSVTITTANAEGYKVGNRYNLGAVAFGKIVVRKYFITPQAGVRYEYAKQDYYNHKQNWVNKYSGGSILYSSVGVQVAYRSMGIRLIGNIPIAQHYADGKITANAKLETGFFVTF